MYNIKWDTDKLIKAFKEVHGDKYDYSKVVYTTYENKVCIICHKKHANGKEHGEFWQTPHAHLIGQGCPRCAGRHKYTTGEFIDRAKEIHGDKYDYSKVEYVNNNTKVCIVCPEHGEFWQTPHKHLCGRGCHKCGNIKRDNNKRDTKELFIEKARKVHGGKYDYSKVEYVNTMTKVCIICPKHGEFWQTPIQHISGYGCKECRKELLHDKFVFTTDEFIKRAKEIHGDKYDYSKVEYDGMHKNVCIICPKHGEFWQKPYSHLTNKGCPSCGESKMEKYIASKLTDEGIKFVRSKRFKWLKMKGSMHLDFYLPDYNVAIECQGLQHLEDGGWYKEDKDKRENLIKNIDRDKVKQRLCTEHNIKVIYYTTYDLKKTDIDIYNESNSFNTFSKIKNFIYDLRL